MRPTKLYDTDCYIVGKNTEQRTKSAKSRTLRLKNNVNRKTKSRIGM